MLALLWQSKNMNVKATVLVQLDYDDLFRQTITASLSLMDPTSEVSYSCFMYYDRV
jgi:hypothetical protein